MKVLIADDNADDRRLLRYNLERHGCQTVIEARDGQEGLEEARAQRPDLIISDALMPRLDGYDFLRQVKLDENLKGIPFVFHSSVYTGEKDEELAARLGAEAFITKPKEPEEFWLEISAILARVSAGQIKAPSPEVVTGEDEYLREYSGVVTAKLAEKVRELEESLARIKEGEAQLRQAQKMEAIGLLAGGIAHDFNNMLMAIIGYGSLLQMKMAADDPLRPNVDKLLTVADRAADLTRSLLTFSRKQESHLQPVNLNTIISTAETFLARVIGENITLQVTFKEDPLNVNADSGQIEQVLMNLATNARDAMPHGGSLSITTASVEVGPDNGKAPGFGAAGRYALIAVTDSGTGMDATTIQRLFEPFFTTKEVGKGTGLGLSIVYGIIQQHGGQINVASEPGKGATFQLYLPLLKGGEVAEAVTLPPPARHEASETILLAEDEAEILKLEREILTECGYTVIEAVDGEDAVRKFQENRERIDLLLFDLTMPNKGGKEAYDEIRKMGSDVRAIFISGYPLEVARENNQLSEKVEMIMKPVSPQNLLRKIREVLDKE